MPKRKRTSTSKIIGVIILIAIVSVAIISWHDGLIGVTPIGEINDSSVDTGTAVTVKGEVILIEHITNTVIIQDDTGGIGFEWGFADSLELHSVVVVRGVVSSIITLTDVSSVQPIWIFA